MTGKFLLVGVAALFAASLPFAAWSEDDKSVSDECEKGVRELRCDINLLNLINGINLNTHQMKHIIAAAKTADNESVSPFNAADTEQLMKTLTPIVNKIEQGASLSEEEMKALRKARSAYNGGENGAKASKARKENLNKLAKGVEEILFESQKQVLEDYKPCLIPPKNLKDPVRVGQANDSSRAVNMLKKLRQIPDKIIDEKRGEIIEAAIERVEKHGGKFKEEERVQVKQKLADIIKKTRAMSDVDFELNKEDLAKELSFLHKIDYLEEKIKELGGTRDVVARKITSFFLNPRMIPLLEERIHQVETHVVDDQTDLDKISPADKCKDGQCAIDDNQVQKAKNNQKPSKK